MADAANGHERKIAAAPLFMLGAAATLAYVAHLIAEHSIAIVEARSLLPRWDLATHLVLGWNDYHLLATGRVHRLLWDLWLQGYWPPMLSIYQIPFYAVMGGGMQAGLWSSLTAFVLTGLTGCAVLWRQWRFGGLLPASIFLALLISSPYLLAYASVTMTETLGALAQLLVILCYVRYRQQSTEKTARAFAISLTILFFTKYNYFFLVVVPLVIHEWLERTSGQSMARLTTLSRWGRRVVSSPTGLLLMIYAATLLVVLGSGGFDAHLFGRRISVHTIGNTGHIVLYLLLARLWYLHRRHRIDWRRLASADLRIRPLLLWFVVPVTIWFASPYPNHIRDFANLVFNRPFGESTVGGGLAAYLDVLRTSYFYSPWMLAFVLAAFGIAAWRYWRQPAWMQWLIIAIPLQLIAIVLHQTRFPRFLLLTVVLLCLVASSEVGGWIAGARRRRVADGILGAVILLLGVAGSNAAVAEERFRRIAFENYTDSPSLRGALQSIRGELTPEDRVAIIGEGNDVSPALFRWELGPPSGVACAPFQIGGAARLDLGLTTRVLLMEGRGDSGGFDVTDYYLGQRHAFLERAERGEFALLRDMPIEELHVVLRLYYRTSKPERVAACQ